MRAVAFITVSSPSHLARRTVPRMIRTWTLTPILFAAACGGSHPSPTTAAAGAGAGCPPAVPAAVTQAYPDATQQGCKAEHEDGKDIFEVKLTKADGTRAELDVSPDGTILQTEEVVPATGMPDAVASAFAAKYPGAQASRVERVTVPGKPVTFEIAFVVGDARKEATFSETGDLVEEEAGEADED